MKSNFELLRETESKMAPAYIKSLSKEEVSKEIYESEHNYTREESTLEKESKPVGSL